jgi:hypothetical protein
MTWGPIWGNRNRTKKSQNLRSSSELTYRMYKLCKLLLVYTFQNHYDENIWKLIVPKTNQEVNEPSYEMVGVKITVTNYGQNNRIFGIFFLVDFLFSSLTTPNVFIVMVLKCTY